MNFEAAKAITLPLGWSEEKCVNKDCGNLVMISPGFKPFGNYCANCRTDAIEHFTSDSRDEAEEEEILAEKIA